MSLHGQNGMRQQSPCVYKMSLATAQIPHLCLSPCSKQQMSRCGQSPSPSTYQLGMGCHIPGHLCSFPHSTGNKKSRGSGHLSTGEEEYIELATNIQHTEIEAAFHIRLADSCNMLGTAEPATITPHTVPASRRRS